jgi:hypothetical protein
MALMGLGTFLRSIRVSFQPDVGRPVSKLVNLEPEFAGFTDIDTAPFSALGTAETDSADTPNNALYVQRLNVDAQKSALYMAGLPDVILRTNPDGPVFSNIGGFQVKWDAWKSAVVQTTWGFRCRILTGGNYTPIGAVFPLVVGDVPLGLIGVTVLGNAPGITSAVKVSLRGFLSTRPVTKKLNGFWNVHSTVTTTSPATTTIYLVASEGINPADYYAVGTIQLVGFRHTAIDGLQILHQGSRKRGKPSGQLAGRRRTPKSFRG